MLAPDAEASPEPVPYQARAAKAGQVVAESTAALRVQVPGGAPLLWFPRSNVDRLALERLGEEAWCTGNGSLADHVAFDHEQVELTLVDTSAGDSVRDVTVKRFPTWGDATDLIEVLDVRPDGPGRFLGAARADWRRPVVEGSQILGQAIVAAARHSPGRRAVSASMVFTRPADARAGYVLELDPVSGGRNFDVVAVRAIQSGRACAVGTLLLDVTAPDVIRHAVSKPDVPGPYGSIPYDMSVTGRDLRIVDDAYTGDPDAPVGPPVLDAWVRFRNVPDDQAIHAGLLAQFTGHLSIAAALRTHPGIGQDQAHRSLSTAINAISLSLHADVCASKWLLYHHESTFAGDGMTHAECRVHNEEGALLASFTVEAMVRGFPESAHGDYRSSL